jgi:hypothetical protein
VTLGRGDKCDWDLSCRTCSGIGCLKKKAGPGTSAGSVTLDRGDNAMSVVSVRGKCVPKAQKGTSLPRDTNLTPYTPQHAVQIARTVGFLFLSLFKIYQSQINLSIQSSIDVIKVKWAAEMQ